MLNVLIPCSTVLNKEEFTPSLNKKRKRVAYLWKCIYFILNISWRTSYTLSWSGLYTLNYGVCRLLVPYVLARWWCVCMPVFESQSLDFGPKASLLSKAMLWVENESESRSVVSHSLRPHGILQVRILQWVAIPSPGDLPNPGTEPRSPSLQADFFTSWATREAIAFIIISIIFCLHRVEILYNFLRNMTWF